MTSGDLGPLNHKDMELVEGFDTEEIDYLNKRRIILNPTVTIFK